MEPGERAAADHREARSRRARLHAHDVRRVRLAAGVPADGHPRPAHRARAAQSGQRQRVRAAHRRRPERLRAHRGPQARRPRRRRDRDDLRRAAGPGCGRAGARGLRARPTSSSCAPPTCATSARRSRCACRADGRSRGDASPTPSTTRTARCTATTSAADAAQQVEWVNLRVSGIGPITPSGAARSCRPATATRRAPAPAAAGRASTTTRLPTPTVFARERLAPGRRRRRPGDHRGVRLDGPAASRLRGARRPVPAIWW